MSQAEGESYHDVEINLDTLHMDQVKAYVSQAEILLPSIGFNKTDKESSDVKTLTSLANVLYYTKASTPTPGGLLASKLESELRVLKKKNYLNDLKSETVHLESKQLELDVLKEEICINANLTKNVIEERCKDISVASMERTARTLASYQADLNSVKDRCEIFVDRNLPNMEEIDSSLSKLEILREEKDKLNEKLQVFTSVPLDIRQAQSLLHERKEYLRSLEQQISASSTDF